MAYGLLFVFIAIGAVLAAVSGFRAVKAWLSYRRVRAEFQGHLTREVDDLARRTAEIEKSLSTLDARAQQLPVRISELQQSLSTLRLLTTALAATLGQAQQALSYNAMKSLSTTRLSTALSGLRRSGRGG